MDPKAAAPVILVKRCQEALKTLSRAEEEIWDMIRRYDPSAERPRPTAEDLQRRRATGSHNKT